MPGPAETEEPREPGPVEAEQAGVPEAAEAEQMLIKDLAHLLALRMKAYVDGCREDGRASAM